MTVLVCIQQMAEIFRLLRVSVDTWWVVDSTHVCEVRQMAEEWLGLPDGSLKNTGH